eukprot:jgi/Tetstr1/443817/TSEL_003271.t1
MQLRQGELDRTSCQAEELVAESDNGHDEGPLETAARRYLTLIRHAEQAKRDMEALTGLPDLPEADVLRPDPINVGRKERAESQRAQIFTCAEHVMLQKAKKALRLNGPDLKVALTATVQGLRAAMTAFKDACTGIANKKNATLLREAKAQATVERARSLAGEGKVGLVRTAIASLEADVIACTKFHKLASRVCDKLPAFATKVDGAQAPTSAHPVPRVASRHCPAAWQSLRTGLETTPDFL